MGITGTKNKRDEYLHIRLGKAEKKRLLQEAESQGIRLSDYARAALVDKRQKMKKDDNTGTLVTMCQDIVNHVQQKYGNDSDEVLKEMIGKIWELLS